MKVHRLAKYFPLLEGEEFDLLVKDIKENGQLEPIVIIEEEILDGVNRYKACQKLGIEPKFKEYKGNDPLSYVISMNIKRRHLTVSQRSALATEMLPEFEKAAKERKENTRNNETGKFMPKSSQDDSGKKHLASDDAAKEFNVSSRNVQRAKRVREKAPEKFEDVVKGKKTVSEVDKEIREKEANERNQKQQDKKDKKLPEEKPKAVKEFLDSIKDFKQAIELATRCAKQEMFSPESKQFIQKQFNQIIEMYNELMENL